VTAKAKQRVVKFKEISPRNGWVAMEKKTEKRKVLRLGYLKVIA